MRGRALFSLLTAVAFATYSVFGLSASYAAPNAGVVEVKPGVLTGKIMDLDEKPVEGKSVKMARGGLSAPLIIAIAGGVLLIGFAAYKIVDHETGDPDYHAPPVSP